MTRSWIGCAGVLAVLGLACGGGDDGGSSGETGDGDTSADSTAEDTANDDTADATAGETSGDDTAGDTAADTAEDTTGDSGDTGTDEFERWELRMPDFSPPVTQTFYSCYAWNIPVEQAVHVVGFEPQVTDPHVHHYVVQMLDEEETRDPSNPCDESPFGDMAWGWAPGGETLLLPDHVGLKGGENGNVTFLLQVHYDNPLGDTFVDSGGFDVLYTNELRENDAGVFTAGDIIGITVPANSTDYEHTASCPGTITQFAFQPDMHILGYWLHAHELGKVLWGDVVRDGEVVMELGREEPYDFDKQTFKDLEVDLQPGDTIRTHCIYDNPNDFDVQGGEATNEEMCINFLLYWPDNPALIERCGI